MTEYAGYIAVNPVDWSKVAREATKDIMAIQDERQKKREELDELRKAVKSASSSFGGSAGQLYAGHQVFDGDDSTTEFTLSFAPLNNMVWVYRNGQLQNDTTHYALSGNKVTMTSTLATGEELEVKYLRQ